MKVIRPWGNYEVLLDSDDCKVKRITVNPGGKLSYQYHHKRSEIWSIVRGQAAVTLDGSTFQVKAGDVVEVPVGCKHRIQNTSDKEDLIFIEVQCGDYFGEDDIVRVEDDYNR